jgi:hypothetical protein
VIVLAVLAWWWIASSRDATSEGARFEEAEPPRARGTRFAASHFGWSNHQNEDEDENETETEVESLRTAITTTTTPHEAPRWPLSPESDTPASIRVENTCDDAITLFWIGYDGAERQYTTLRPGRFVEQATFEGHEWLVRSSTGAIVARFAGTDGDVIVPCADGTPARAHASVREDAPPADCPICSPRSTTEAAFSAESHCALPVRLVWRDFRGATRDYGVIAPRAIVTQHSYVGHRWEVVDDEGTTVARYVVEEDGEHVVACL